MDYPLCKNVNFAFFLNPCWFCLERLVFIKYFFWVYFASKETLTKFQIFDQNQGLTPLEKCQFCGFLKLMFSLFGKACLLYKTSKIVFSRFIFAIYDMGIPGVTRGYRGLKGVTRGYKGWQGVTRGYKGLKGVTRGERGLQGVTGGYKGWQGVTRGYRGLQGFTRGDRGLQGVTRRYKGWQGVTRADRGWQGVTGGYKGL